MNEYARHLEFRRLVDQWLAKYRVVVDGPTPRPESKHEHQSDTHRAAAPASVATA